MTLKTTLIAGLLCVAAVAQGASATPPPPTESEIPLGERTARIGVRIEEPEGLHGIKRAVERSFGVELSIEPLPEQCAGAAAVEVPLEPFTIVAGERFDAVIARLEEASQGRWIFEEIYGVPLLHPNSSLEGHGTLLDTVINVDIKASSVWEALCALARVVNRTNGVPDSGKRPLLFMFLEPGILLYPPPMFVEKKCIEISLNHVPAREGLCAILEQVSNSSLYSYTCVAPGNPPAYDYVTIQARDKDGKAINGGRMHWDKYNEYERLMKTASWMSMEGIMAAQVPEPENTAGTK